MATIKPYRKGYRVRWWVTIKGVNNGKSTEHEKNPDTLDEAKELEAAAVHRLPHDEKIGDWIGLNLITPDEADEMFNSYEAPAETKELGSDTWSQIELATLNLKEKRQTDYGAAAPQARTTRLSVAV